MPLKIGNFKLMIENFILYKRLKKTTKTYCCFK